MCSTWAEPNNSSLFFLSFGLCFGPFLIWALAFFSLSLFWALAFYGPFILDLVIPIQMGPNCQTGLLIRYDLPVLIFIQVPLVRFYLNTQLTVIKHQVMNILNYFDQIHNYVYYNRLKRTTGGCN